MSSRFQPAPGDSLLAMLDTDQMLHSFNSSLHRPIWESTGLCLLFIAITFVAAFSNVAVIISAILERWKEVDNFTFVFCVSLSFNHFFLAFHIHSMVAYSVVANSWELHIAPCFVMGVLSCYLNNVYLLQIMLLVFDSAVARYSNLRVAISVSLSKKIAFHTWMIGVLPQVVPVLLLKKEDPYLYQPLWGGCFQSYLYRDLSSLFECLVTFLIIPLGILIIWYVVLLFKEEGNRRLAITVSRMKAEEGFTDTHVWRRHRTTAALSTMFCLTTLPYSVISLVAMPQGGSLDGINRHLLQIANILFCMGSIFIPVLYVLFCPTFCRFVLPEKRFSPLYRWLFRFTHPPRSGEPSENNVFSGQNNHLNMIEEEDEDEEDYIELPAISVSVAYQQMQKLEQPTPKY